MCFNKTKRHFSHSILFWFSDHYLETLELNQRSENNYTILTTSFSLCPPNGSLLFPVTEMSFYLLKGDSVFPSLYLLMLPLSFIYWISSPPTPNSSFPQIHKEHTLVSNLVLLYLLTCFFHCVKNRTYSEGMNTT